MNLEVRDGVHGRGVWATEPIPAGTHLLDFRGPLLTAAETPGRYAIQVGPDRYIGESDDLDDLVNHSCEPNCGVVIDDRGVRLVAIRDIAAGEELFFDYATTLDEDDWTMPCRCGVPSCRGVVRDGKYLPDAVWDRYVALGIVPDYVRRSREAMRARE